VLTEIYAHLDEEQRVNAQKFEAAFYSNPDLRELCASPSISGQKKKNAANPVIYGICGVAKRI